MTLSSQGLQSAVGIAGRRCRGQIQATRNFRSRTVPGPKRKRGRKPFCGKAGGGDRKYLPAAAFRCSRRGAAPAVCGQPPGKGWPLKMPPFHPRRNVGTSFISLTPTHSVRVRSFRCASSPQNVLRLFGAPMCDGCDDCDGIFDTAPTLILIVTTVTIVTLPVPACPG